MTVPSDACADAGDVVNFTCFAVSSVVASAPQEWVVTPTSGPAIMFRSVAIEPLPTGFSFIADPLLSGIAVTANLNLSNATLECTVFVVENNKLLMNTSKPAILQVAGMAGVCIIHLF